MISGNGDVIEPEEDHIAIGSGGPYAQAAAKALMENTDLSAREIALRDARAGEAMRKIAARFDYERLLAMLDDETGNG